MSRPVLQASRSDVEGAKIHWVSGGQGSTMLFLHGFPEFWFAWRAQLSAFVKTHRVVAVDLPGCNLSDPLPQLADYALDRVADRIAAFIRQIAPHERVCVVGHDVGGFIAWELAARHPELVERLIVINAPPFARFAARLATDPAQREASAYIRALRDPGTEGILGAGHFAHLGRFLFESAREPGVFTPADRKAYFASWSRPNGLGGALSYYRAANFESPAPPPAVQAPTLVLWGEKDTYLLPGCLEGIEGAGHDVTVQRVPHATHWIVREEPELVNESLRSFLGSSAAPQRATREFWYESSGTRLFGVEQGRGTPVILLHGAVSDHRVGLLFFAGLEASHRLITPDVRGAGRSLYAGELTWEQLSADLLALLDHLGLERAVIGGISLGAAIALSFALRHPSRVRALLLVHPAHAGRQAAPNAAFQAVVASLDELGRRVLLEGVTEIQRVYADQPPALRQRLLEIASQFDPASFATTVRFLASDGGPFERFETLEAVKVPTLVVPGNDPIHPFELGEQYARALPNATQSAPSAPIAATISAFLRNLG